MTTKLLARALREAGTAKEIAQVAGVSWRTAERWQRGQTEPRASMLMKLMAASRKVAQAIAEGTGLTDELLDAEQARLIDQLAELRARRRANGVGADAEKGALDVVADMAARAAERGLK